MLRPQRKWTWRDSKLACGLFWLKARRNTKRWITLIAMYLLFLCMSAGIKCSKWISFRFWNASLVSQLQPVRDLAVYIFVPLLVICFVISALMFPAGGSGCGETRGVWGESLQRDHKDAASKVPADLPPWHSTNEEWLKSTRQFMYLHM